MSATALLERNPQPDRARGEGRAAGQPLPLHRVLEHRRGRRRRREGRCVVTAVETETGTLQKGAAMGQSVPRKEDNRLVQGQGLFYDDVKRHGMGYLHFVRSPYAHAKILSIDVSAALELPGVYGTLTGDEVAILTDPFFQIAAPPGGARQGLRPRRRQSALPGRARRRRRGRDARAGARRGRARVRRLRAAARRRRRPARGRRRRAGPARGGRRQHVLHRRLGVGRRRRAPSPRPTTSSPSRSSTSTASTRRRWRPTGRSSSTTAAPASGRSPRTTSSPASPRS